jgi:hypothetical protein
MGFTPALTPALSPRRGSVKSCVVEEIVQRGCSHRLPVVLRENVRITRRVRITGNRRTILPLLGGEGWGEVERSSDFFPNLHIPLHSAHA